MIVNTHGTTRVNRKFRRFDELAAPMRYVIFVAAVAMLHSGCSEHPLATRANNDNSAVPEKQSDPQTDMMAVAAARRSAVPTIPGFSAESLYTNFKTGFRQTTFPADGAIFWMCRKDQGDYLLEVSAFGNQSSNVQAIQGFVRHPGRMPSNDAMSKFLGDVAALEYQGADPQKARGWGESEYYQSGHRQVDWWAALPAKQR